MNHREAIGGMWEQMGQLQFDFFKNLDLRPSDYFLDIGCGSLRGGVKFIDYLEDCHYFALEKEKEILDAGIEKEFIPLDIPKNFTFHLTGEFEIPEDWPEFDFMLAQSVFTHLLPEQINDCISKVVPRLKDNGSFFATYFHSEKEDPGQKHGWRSNERAVASYPFKMFEDIAESLGVRVFNYGDWNHPRDQKMLEFRK